MNFHRYIDPAFTALQYLSAARFLVPAVDCLINRRIAPVAITKLFFNICKADFEYNLERI